ncbi:transposase [Streptomyces sp. NPDC048384]|uniref:IS701 family transposase n=1 Tax=Streptomyces sp. NPDC048384 TaxID=3155487 RepID=UPI00342B5751
MTVPASLVEALGILRSCFTAPTFATLCALVTGTLSATGRRTVTGMWAAAGLAGRSHWSRGHRFFSHAAWELDEVGPALACAVVALFVPRGGDVTVAVDDSLFPRFGKRVFGIKWQHDGSARGRDGLGLGNCFVVAGIVVTVPFMERHLCLPVLFRLHVPKQSTSKTTQARQLVDLLIAALPGRRVHVVGDALYRGPTWRDLPPGATFTTRLASNAVLYGSEPPPTGKRGHPRWKGDRLGTPTDLARIVTWRKATVKIYDKVEEVFVAERVCLWWGSLHRTPVKVVLMRRVHSKRLYDWALVTTDTAATGEAIVIRYGARWSIEQANRDGKEVLGAGQTHSRLKRAVERSVPFVMACQTIAVLWYAQAGRAATDLTVRRTHAPWYRQKTHISMIDILAAFHRARIQEAIAAQASARVIVIDGVTWEATAA